MVARGNKTFRAVIGPSGNERGYQSITGTRAHTHTHTHTHVTHTHTHTGQASWGIAWYLDGVLIPELVIQRGSTYTFMVEGGSDPNEPSEYHPFYITTSSTGSRLSDPANSAVSLLCGS